MTKSEQLKNSNTEIIAIASGKGGTGKTLFAASLGYALVNSGNRVLFIDSDIGTDGLSLFLLGQKNIRAIRDAPDEVALINILRETNKSGEVFYKPLNLNRRDHSARKKDTLAYEAIVSSRSLFGDEDLENTDIKREKKSAKNSHILDLNKKEFTTALSLIIKEVKSSGKYDYVVVDTRGGFAYQSVIASALADSFIVVTEPDYTSFYQDRNLVKRIGEQAQVLGKSSVLRAIVVNKATDGEEKDFRLALEREFKISYGDTYSIPLDMEAIKCYKTQKLPFVNAASSQYSFHTINVLSSIMRIVTSEWDKEMILKWNQEVERIESAIDKHNFEIEAEQNKQKKKLETFQKNEELVKEQKGKIDHLQMQLVDKDNFYHAEIDHLKQQLVDKDHFYHTEKSRTQSQLDIEVKRANEYKTELNAERARYRAREDDFKTELNAERAGFRAKENDFKNELHGERSRAEENVAKVELEIKSLQNKYDNSLANYEQSLSKAVQENKLVRKDAITQRRFLTMIIAIVLAASSVFIANFVL